MEIKNSLHSKNAVIIGATSDIGESVARLFSQAGANVLLAGRNVQRLQQLGQELHCNYFQLDLLNDISYDDLFLYLKNQSISLDILVNLAGVWHDDDRSFFGTSLQDYSWKEMDAILQTGVLGSIRLAYLLSPLMSAGGKMIFTSSQFNDHSAKGCFPYFVACKSIEVATSALAMELSDSGIKTYCISPSYIATSPCKKFFPKESTSAMTPETLAHYYLRSALGQYKSGTIISP